MRPPKLCTHIPKSCLQNELVIPFNAGQEEGNILLVINALSDDASEARDHSIENRPLHGRHDDFDVRDHSQVINEGRLLRTALVAAKLGNSSSRQSLLLLLILCLLLGSSHFVSLCLLIERLPVGI